jgi:hypothetical protein
MFHVDSLSELEGQSDISLNLLRDIGGWKTPFVSSMRSRCSSVSGGLGSSEMAEDDTHLGAEKVMGVISDECYTFKSTKSHMLFS